MLHKEQRVCYAHVLLPDGTTAKREVVIFDKAGQPCKHFPLTEELPFVEWRDETFVWNGKNADAQRTAAPI